jgi:hypothetical protein
VFCFQHIDRNGDARWAFNPRSEDAGRVLFFLCQMAQLTWAEIEAQKTGSGTNRHKKHHDQEVESLRSEAREALHQRKLGVIFGDSNIFRFRVDGTTRLWGFRQGRIFHVVWWDPNHQVYPTEPN